MKNYAVGVDVGGTTIKIGLFSKDGQLLTKEKIPTNTEDHGVHIVEDIAAKVNDILASRRIEKDSVIGIGIGVPGPVLPDGRVNKCVNLGWDIYPIESELAKASGLPVKAANDANIAALGEAWMGSGKGYSSIVMVTLGTGVGGGIVLNGKILTGFGGAAGEIGHIQVNPGEVTACNCGLHGCLEQYASASGIIRMGLTNNHLDKWKDSPLYGRDSLTGKDVTDAANAGDPLGYAILKKAMTYLGNALATIADVVNPEAILIGGGVSEAGQIVLDLVTEPFEKNVFHACKNTKILLALLSNDAGIYGGAKLAIDSQE